MMLMNKNCLIQYKQMTLISPSHYDQAQAYAFVKATF